MAFENITPGLMSVTFRSLTVERIIDLALAANLKAIGWSGDVHVPDDNLGQVAKVGRLTRQAGLEVASYCSYYCAGASEQKRSGPFDQVGAAAVALGAPFVRVWAGNKGSGHTSSEEFEKIVLDTQRIADKAAQKNLKIAFEYHTNTLTDSAESALKLIRAVDRNNVKLNWQPPNPMDFASRLESLHQVAGFLGNLHVFHWQMNESKAIERLALKQGAQDWKNYFKQVDTKRNKPCYAMIEFVKDNTQQQFLEDATVLCSIID